MAEYGINLDQVLATPVKQFWFISNMVDRLRAERDLRVISTLSSVTSAEAYESTVNRLNDHVGQVYVFEKEVPTEIRIDPKTGLDAEFDREGFRSLKMDIACGR